MSKSIGKSIRNNLLVGLILVTPLVVTGLVVNWLFGFATNRIVKLIPQGWREAHPEILFRVLALVAVLVFLFLVGLFARNILGRRLYQLGDMVLVRIPLINKIYVSVRQISEALLDQSQKMFKQVVLVEYPRKGLYSVGFVTADVPKDMRPANLSEDLVAVFIPTSPNPTSGWFVFVPRSELFVMPISVGDAMKLVVSGGAVFPGTAAIDDRPTLLDKLEVWMARESKS
ncbi:MAG: DUF502 domain-containing protein [Verrucomicrobiota bacterium]